MIKMRQHLVAALAMLAAGCPPVNAGPWPSDDVTTTYYDGIGSESPAQARPEIYNGMLRLKDVIGARGSASGVCPLDAASKVPLANIPDTLTGKTVSGGTDIAIADGGTGASDATTARANLGCATNGANTDISSVAVGNTGLSAKDPTESFKLTFKPGTNLTTNRTLTIKSGNTDRALDISAADVTISTQGAELINDTSYATMLATMGAAGNGANTDITSVTLGNTGLKLKENATTPTETLTVAPGSALTANRQLTITTGDYNRTLDISANNVTISTAGAGLIDDASYTDMRDTLKTPYTEAAANTSNLNTITKPGLYQLGANTATNYPSGATSFATLLAGGDKALGADTGFQLALGYTNNEMYYRGVDYQTTDVWTSWVKIWNSGNDGSGSGLDADTVDGYHESALAKAGANTDITSLTGITGSVTSTKECVDTTWTRIMPNLCVLNGLLTKTSVARDTCTAIAVPSGATAVGVYVTAHARNAGAIGSRTAQMSAYTNNTCNGNYVLDAARADAYEFSAVTGGSYLLGKDVNVVTLVPTNGYIYLAFSDDTGNQGSGQYGFLWYTD